MPETHDGSDRSTNAHGSGGPNRVQSSPYRVEPGNIWFLASKEVAVLLTIRTNSFGLLTWEEVSLSPIKLPRTSAILFLQGVGLQPWIDTQVLSITGEMFFSDALIGLSVERLSPTGHLTGVVLASPLHMPENVSEQDVKGIMLGAYLAP